VSAGVHLGRRDYAVLGSIVAANVGIRLLELSERAIVPYFRISDAIVASPWRLLLPLDIGDGYSRWSTTGLAVVGLLQLLMSASAVFLLFNVALVVGAFALGWRCTRSRPFAFALAACMAATTQYHWTYANAGVLPLYLTSLFMLWQLAALVWLVWDGAQGAPRRPRMVFVLSLLILALSWEQWLDYWVFLLAFGGLLYAAAGRYPQIRKAEVRWALLVSAVVGVVYVVVKLGTAPEHSTPGKESELITGYLLRDGLGLRNGAVLAMEDVASNFFTYTYLSLTNLFPPALLPGQSLNNLPLDAIVGAQRGYHPQMAHLVGYHHIFLWYAFAGLLAGLLIVFTALAARRALRAPSVPALAAAGGGMLVLLGSATHLVIKYRPYLSEPFLHYKAGIGVTGASVLLAFLFAQAWMRRGVRGRRILAGAGAAVLVWGALSRPPALSGMATRMQMGTFPDPAATARNAVVQSIHRHYKPTKQRLLRAVGM
jgi:hypothetical protein